MKTSSHRPPTEHPVAIAAGVIVAIGAATLAFAVWKDGATRTDLVAGPKVAAVDFDEVRIRRDRADEPRANDRGNAPISSPRTVDAPRSHDDEGAALRLDDDPLATGTIGTVDLDKRPRDLVGVERVRTTIISDDAFRAAIDRWDAPERCARDGPGAKAIALTLTIAPSGEVLSARAHDVTTVAERRVASCMIAHVGTLAFPKTDSDTEFERAATFVF